MKTVKVIESIITWQGEGIDVGKRMLLLRFKHCNLNCSWCDTKVKMRVLQEATYPIEQLQKIINEEKCGLMITGGEPTFDPHFHETVTLLSDLNYPFANVESNGYNLLELVKGNHGSENISYIYSPKILKDDDYEKVLQTTVDIMKYPNVYIKYVIGKDDNENILTLEYLKLLNNLEYNNRVYLMPKGENEEQLKQSAPTVFDLAEEFKFNFSTRSHIIYNFV